MTDGDDGKELELRRSEIRVLDPVLTEIQQQQFRELTKIERLQFTDAIKAFTQYVGPDGVGSTRPGMAYRNFTAMVYRPAELNALQKRAKAAGVATRDAMSHSDRRFVMLVESSTAGILLLRMTQGWPRDDIKAAVKANINMVAEVMKPSIELAKMYRKKFDSGSET